MRAAAPVRPNRPVLAGRPLLIAHRGGAALAPENTLTAFRQAVTAWPVDMIELDVRATADGHCVVIHDETVDRTTDGTGPVAGLTLAELKRLDAGFRFTAQDGGQPFRGRGVRVPTLPEVLEALPDVRLTLEVKVGAAQAPMFRAIAEHGAKDRVVVAGMRETDRTLFRSWDGAVSASTRAVRRFYVAHRFRVASFWPLRADVVQVPEIHGGARLVSPRFVRDVHARGVDIHIWTVDDPDDMRRLLDWGVDGIITDRPDRLAGVLAERVGG